MKIKTIIQDGKMLALSKTARDTYLMSFGGGVSSMLGAIFTIWVARLLGPENFGIFSALLAFILLILGFSDLGVSSALMRFLPPGLKKKDFSQVNRLLKTAFLIVSLFSLLILLVLLISNSFFTQLIFGNYRFGVLFQISVLAVLSISLSSLLIFSLRAKARFFPSVVVENSLQIFKLAGVLLLVVIGKLTLPTTLWVISLTPLLGVGVGLFFLKTDFFGAKTDLKTARLLLGFGSWLALSQMVNAVSSRLDVLMLVRMTDATITGFYSAASRIVLIFPVLISSVSAVLAQRISSLETHREAKIFFKRMILLTLGFVILAGVLYLGSVPIVYLLFGATYLPTIPIFRALLLSMFFFSLTVPSTLTLLYFFSKPQVFFLLALVQLGTIIVFNLIFIPRFGGLGPAFSLALTYGIIFVISTVYVVAKLKKEK